MAGLSDFTQSLISWVINPIFWILVIMGVIGFLFAVLLIRKNKRLKLPTCEIVTLSQMDVKDLEEGQIEGRFAFNFGKSGWFGEHMYARGLWWTGRPVLRLSTGEVVQNFSTEDYQEVNGRRGVVVFRHPLNKGIVVPVSKMKFDEKGVNAIAEIPDASYVTACIDMFKEVIKETEDSRSKVIQAVLWGLVIIGSVLALIFVIQYAKFTQKSAQELLLLAGEKGTQACKDIWSQAISQANAGRSP